MDLSYATVMVGAGGEAYAQWVKRAMARALSSHPDVHVLFGSSVDEPVEQLRQTVEDGFRAPITSRYQSVFIGGNPFVIDQLCAKYAVSKDHVLPTTGATGALSILYRTFLSPGSHVLVESPGFDLFADIAHALHAEVDHFHRKGHHFEIDLTELERQIRPDTKLIVLSNLHNPSGMLIPESVLQDLAAIAARHDIKVIVDEVYGDYADREAAPRRAVQLAENCISVSSLTKIYGLSTLRCGWIVAPPDVMAPVRSYNDRYEFGISKLSHAVAALVMENRASFDDYSNGIIDGARPVLEHFYAQWIEQNLVDGPLPDFGCIAFPRLTDINDTKRFCAWLADKYGVIVVPGELFGAAGHIRIGFGHPTDQLERALTLLTQGLTEYRAEAEGKRVMA